jgi:Lipocalin-like domain
MSVVCDGRKELPEGVSREYSSYCGNYTYDGKKLVTRVDAASDPNRIGSDQVRGVRFEGARIVLIPPPRRIGESEGTPRDHLGSDSGGIGSKGGWLALRVRLRLSGEVRIVARRRVTPIVHASG